MFILKYFINNILFNKYQFIWARGNQLFIYNYYLLNREISFIPESCFIQKLGEEYKF